MNQLEHGCKILLLAMAASAFSALHISDKIILQRPNMGSGLGSSLGMFDGIKIKIKKSPFMAAIVVYRDSEDSPHFFCAATIVSKSWLLMDAIFADHIYDISRFAVVTASEDGGATGTKYKIKAVNMHPKFSNYSLAFAYALVRIHGEFTWSNKTMPVKLPRGELKDYTVMNVTGYGDGNDPKQNLKLVQGNMTWLSKRSCKKIFNGFDKWYNTNACAFNKGKTTLCHNDFSDPFTVGDVMHGFAVLLFVDRHFCTSKAEFPVIIMNVHPVCDWIKKTTGARYEDE